MFPLLSPTTQSFWNTTIFDKEGDEIACVIVEAVAGNMNMVPATQEFLETMREETAKHGTVLIVDEVMTGFRVALGGAQSLYHIDPDITMFGKVIGGGRYPFRQPSHRYLRPGYAS